MTFEEARKILDEENCFCIINVVKPLEVIELLPWENTEVNEAIATMGEYGYRASYVRMADTENRLKKLKAKYDKAHPAKKNDTRKDYEKVAQIVDKLIEEEGEPINGEHLNPALRDSAKQFNDALLDEQAKKIKKLEATIENREKEIDILNDTMARRIKDIQDLKQTVKSDNAIIEQYEKKVKELENDLKFCKEQEACKSREVVAIKAKLARNSDNVIQGLKNEHIETIMSILKEYGITIERVFGQEITGEEVLIPFECPEFISKAIKTASKLGYRASYSQDGIFDLDITAKKEEQNKKLNDIIASRNNEILELQEKVKKMAKMGKTIAHLNEVIGKKNAQLKDYKIACEEHDEQLKDYMLSDKNKDDMISGLKKLNEGLRHKLAEIIVSKDNDAFVADVLERQRDANRHFNELYDKIIKKNLGKIIFVKGSTPGEFIDDFIKLAKDNG